MEEALRILIVEDDAIIGESIHMHLSELGHAPYTPVTSESEATKFMDSHPVDLALLDIRLEDGDSGIALAHHIDEKRDFPYIFLTAYTDDKTLAEVGATRPSGFIVKPFRKNDMKAAIAIASLNRQLAMETSTSPAAADAASQSLPNHVFINVGGEWERVQIADILYLQSAHVYTEIHTVQGKKVTRRSLSQLVDDLEAHGILRIHRSMAVNLNRVSRYDSHSLQVGDQEFSISASCKRAVKDRMNSI